MDQSQIILVGFAEQIACMSREELIEQVAAKKLENELLKKQMKFTESYIYEAPKENQQTLGNPKKIFTQKPAQIPNPTHNSPKQEMKFAAQLPLYQQAIQKRIQTAQQANKFKPLGKIRLGADHYCPKKHHLHFQKQAKQFNCSKCNKKSGRLCWSCLGCNYHQCIACKTYPKYHCPYNDILQPSGTLGIDLSKRMCEVCKDQIQANSFTCPGCNYDLCYKCAKN